MSASESILLKTFTTMKIGGAAERLLKLRDLKEVSTSLPKPLRILGNGSNILIDDRGLKGTVIVVRDFPPTEPEILESTSATAKIRVSAGIFLPTLCRWTQRQGFSGCEYMIGVPGTLGGAVAQNAGANEQEISTILISADIFDLDSQSLTTWSAKDLQLSYRSSVLHTKDTLIVVSAILQLSKAKSTSEIEALIQKNLDYRKSKTPSTKPSLGSIFTRLPDPQNPEAWIYPGKLIEKSGLKGKRQGGAQISPIHANYITNEGGATFDDVMTLIHLIEKMVQDKFKIQMRREILIWSDR